MANEGVLRRPIARCSSRSVRFLNLLVMGGSIGCIVLQARIERPISLFGWGILMSGILTFISGFMGCLASNQRECFSAHLLILAISFSCLAVDSILMFLKLDLIIGNMNVSATEEQSKTHIHMQAYVLIILAIVQLLVGLLGILVYFCDFQDVREGQDLNRVIGDGTPTTVVWTSTKIIAPQLQDTKKHASKKKTAQCDQNSTKTAKDSSNSKNNSPVLESHDSDFSFDKTWKAKDIEIGRVPEITRAMSSRTKDHNRSKSISGPLNGVGSSSHSPSSKKPATPGYSDTDTDESFSFKRAFRQLSGSQGNQAEGSQGDSFSFKRAFRHFSGPLRSDGRPDIQ